MQDSQEEIKKVRHQHDYEQKDTFLVCKICQDKKLALQQTQEGISQGIRSDGRKYSVRDHRMNYFMPDVWDKFYDELPSEKSKRTAQVLIQTGARINETRHIRKQDIDFDRNTIRLITTKRKSHGVNIEKKGKPRTIPISSQYAKELRRWFKDKEDSAELDILRTGSFNTTMSRTLKRIDVKNGYMFSAHNIRKTHGNWLKVMGNLKLMNVDAMEICLRLGHDYATYLKHYGSAGVMNSQDILLIQKTLGDLYTR